jgi:hypothetical protein
MRILFRTKNRLRRSRDNGNKWRSFVWAGPDVAGTEGATADSVTLFAYMCETS